MTTGQAFKKGHLVCFYSFILRDNVLTLYSKYLYYPPLSSFVPNHLYGLCYLALLLGHSAIRHLYPKLYLHTETIDFNDEVIMFY